MSGPGRLASIITADPSLRDRSIDELWPRGPGGTPPGRGRRPGALPAPERQPLPSGAALLFLYAIHRFYAPPAEHHRRGRQPPGLIPYAGYTHLLQRRFEEAIGVFLDAQARQGPSDALSSALAATYHGLGFQTLADQVRRSVRAVRGNQWMFRTGHPMDQPLRLRPELLRPSPEGLYPILHEATPVRMDLTHSGWSDIFFLGMDYPEGARVLNVSIDLAVREARGGRGRPRPPVEAFLRVIDEPVLRLVSVDLGATADVTSLAEVFDFARDYLGLLKAAVIAAGIVPPGWTAPASAWTSCWSAWWAPAWGWRSSGQRDPQGLPPGRLHQPPGQPDRRLHARHGQAASLEGPLRSTRRLWSPAPFWASGWAGRAGAGRTPGACGPGSLITGVLATPEDPEWGVSRGRLLPAHHILDSVEVSPRTRARLQESLVLVHGGMAQNVGPILEMVTERYLLRSPAEWEARQEACRLYDQILGLLGAGDVQGPRRRHHAQLQRPHPDHHPLGHQPLHGDPDRRRPPGPGEAYWGFWMLGGMSGGGMGFLVDPRRHSAAQDELLSRCAAPNRASKRRSPSPWSPWCTTWPSTSG